MHKDLLYLIAQLMLADAQILMYLIGQLMAGSLAVSNG
jgi:hypothetical protein